jgi:tRNA (guanosine-2'-O-)-methyltransferase
VKNNNSRVGNYFDLETDRGKKIQEVLARRSDNIVILEDIHDPHNAAAVWRSCDAFGIGRVCLIFDKEKKFNPKNVGKESSSSANKWIDFEIFYSTEECLKTIKDKGYTVFGTVLDRNATKLQTSIFQLQKNALLLGNEHRGLSEMAIKMSDHKIYISMKGMVQSLNLSVTAGICLYEIERQVENQKLDSGS